MSDEATVDSIIQSVAVDLLASHGVTAVPLPPTPSSKLPSPPDLVSFGRFDATGCTGSLYLGCPPGVVELAEDASGIALKRDDWIRELCNQLVGRVKRRFLQFGVLLHTGLPALGNKRLLRRPQGTAYYFRTIRGTFVVVLDAQIDAEVFVYQNDVQLQSEGDIILF